MNNLKFAFLNNCVFCENKLPPIKKRTGDGEHVFPKNIFGFWKSRDVCVECVRYFGIEIDKLTNQNIEIQKAKNVLKLDSKKYTEGTEFEGIDSFNSKKVDFILKEDKPRIKFIKTNDFFQFSEDKLETIGLDWIKKDRIKYLDNETIDIETKKLMDKYNKAEYGHIVYNKKLKVSIRKAKAKIFKLKDSKTKSLNKLTGKIVFIFLNYFLERENLDKLVDLQNLKNYIMNDTEIPEFTIYRCEYFKNENYSKNHFIKIDICEGIVFVYVVYFGYISYVVNLRTNGIVSTKYQNLKGEFKDIESLIFALDFEGKRKMILEIKLENENEYIHSEFEL